MLFTTGSGAPVLVGSRLAGGGQGEVFSVPYPQEHVFKRYFPRELERDPTLERRLRAMVANKPRGWQERGGHITMAWPSDLVLESGSFAGFLMPVVNMADTVGIHRITNPSDRLRRDLASPAPWTRSFTWRYLVRAGANLAQVTDSLHMADTVIGDFNDANVRVGKDARVTLLDCDSMQIKDPVSLERFFCRVGRPEFTPPELMNADWNRTVRHPSGDLFALAIHLYALLLEGEHPFRGVWRMSGDKPPVPDLARRGIWAHRGGGPLAPRPAAIGISLLPGRVRELFRAAFETSAVNPAGRPDARQWHQALTWLEDDLRTCPVEPSHVYPHLHREACPWCRHASRLPAADLPAPAGGHRADGRRTPPPPPRLRPPPLRPPPLRLPPLPAPQPPPPQPSSPGHQLSPMVPSQLTSRHSRAGTPLKPRIMAKPGMPRRPRDP